MCPGAGDLPASYPVHAGPIPVPDAAPPPDRRPGGWRATAPRRAGQRSCRPFVLPGWSRRQTSRPLGHRRQRDHERPPSPSPSASASASASRRWRSCSTMNALCRSSASTNSSDVMMPFATSRSRRASTAAVDATMPPSAGSSGSSADTPDSLPPPASLDDVSWPSPLPGRHGRLPLVIRGLEPTCRPLLQAAPRGEPRGVRDPGRLFGRSNPGALPDREPHYAPSSRHVRLRRDIPRRRRPTCDWRRL
jgi:hypothetical protein